MKSKPKPELFEDKAVRGDWRVETICDDEGDVDVAIFSGPRAEMLAREYWSWQMSRRRADKSNVTLKSCSRLYLFA